MTLLLTLTLACSGGTDTGDSADDTGQSTTTTTTTTDDTGETEAVDLDKDGVPADMDCDDEDPDVHYGNDEICDDKDNDCNGVVDDTYALDATTWYLDADGDDRGVDDIRTYSCTEPEGYASAGGDCNDLEATIYPGADEVCDDTDQDCDDRVDEDAVGDGATWYADYDEDGFGTPDYVRETCAQPDGYVDNDEDCDDQDSDAWPGSVEVCDGGDDDCDGEVDEDNSADASTYYIDYDGDGYGSDAYTISACELPDGWSETQDDCDDVEADVHPGADEFCNDIDDNCDSEIDDDDDDLDLTTATKWHDDDDGDGFGDDSAYILSCDAPSGTISEGTDCDDDNAKVNTDATEICNDIDDDCDGDTDDEDADLDTSTASTWYADDDSDSYGDSDDSTLSCDAPTGAVSDDTDCDDTNKAVNPGATEICNSGVDDDCSGQADDEDSGLDTSTATTWYTDNDGDKYGDPGDSSVSCESPDGAVTDGSDCEDGDAAVNPGATEVCNGIDDDCDSATDDADSDLDLTTATTWYADSDGDSYGDSATSALTCDAPSGYGEDNTDCNDTDSSINPGASEVCNDVDDDCDGLTDDDDGSLDTGTATSWYSDGDGDGYGTSSSSVYACDQPANTTDNTSDCDDSDSSINPGAAEVCVNATDENCDGNYSEGCSQQYVSCGGPSAMGPGTSLSCSVGTTAIIEGVYISVGCNDGETASYTVSFEDGGSEGASASCGSTTSFSDHVSNSVSLYMSGGGGGDSWISFTCCGSGGWGIYYR